LHIISRFNRNVKKKVLRRRATASLSAPPVNQLLLSVSRHILVSDHINLVAPKIVLRIRSGVVEKRSVAAHHGEGQRRYGRREAGAKGASRRISTACGASNKGLKASAAHRFPMEGPSWATMRSHQSKFTDMH
jgi:hypothetical protein